MKKQSVRSENEKRFELAAWGLALLLFAVAWIFFDKTLPGLMTFLPGVIIVGSALYQDIQEGWSASPVTYFMGIIMTAVGITSLISSFLGDVIHLNWVVVSIAIMGTGLLIKAFKDLSL